mmetsp:Transcript_53479/g.130654  ORF Transcript_53479/g.130654 Transcript_53479/m.130654 type:complete len:743 (+) Transcript_53479:213-2441(+)
MRRTVRASSPWRAGACAAVWVLCFVAAAGAGSAPEPGGSPPQGGKCHAQRGKVNILSVTVPSGTRDSAATLARVDALLSRPSNGSTPFGCIDLIILKELFSFNSDVPPTDDRMEGPQAAAETADGPTMTACRSWAVRFESYVLCSYAELASEDALSEEGLSPVYNTAELVDRGGLSVGKYRKTFPNYGHEVEWGFLAPMWEGSLPLFETDFGTVGVLICFDVMFPELWQELEVLGAEVVLWPSAMNGTDWVRAYSFLHHYAAVANGRGAFFDPGGFRIDPYYAEGDPHGGLLQAATMDLGTKMVHKEDPVNAGTYARPRMADLLQAYQGEIVAQDIAESFVAVRGGSRVSAEDALNAVGMRDVRDYRRHARAFMHEWRKRRTPMPLAVVADESVEELHGRLSVWEQLSGHCVQSAQRKSALAVQTELSCHNKVSCRDSLGFFDVPEAQWERMVSFHQRQLASRRARPWADPFRSKDSKESGGEDQAPKQIHDFATFVDRETARARSFLMDVYHPTWSCEVDERLGEKWTCDTHKLAALPAGRCLVYSFGSRTEFDFEERVHELNNGCEIHVFDPFVEDPQPPDYVFFHAVGLGGADAGKLMKLSTIVKELGHADRVIDILKVDIEGYEYDAYPFFFDNGVHKWIRQILIEIHMHAKYHPTMRDISEDQRWWTLFPAEGLVGAAQGLMDHFTRYGYAMFHKEVNLNIPGAFVEGGSTNAEFSFVKVGGFSDEERRRYGQNSDN